MPPRSLKVAYLVSRFPVVTETFILRELLALEARGAEVEIFSLVRQREAVVHPEAEPLVRRTHYGRVLSLALLRAHLHFLLRKPRVYASVWREALRGNWGSAEFFTRALFVLWQAPYFARQMQRAGVTHVHAHWATHPALAAFSIARLTGLPYSFTAHAHDLYVQRAMLGKKLKEAQFVVTISAFNRRLIAELYGPQIAQKTAVVHCGVDPAVFVPPKASSRQPNDIFTLICIASLRDYKGHRHLIDACALLRERSVPFRCLLIGDGEERPKLEAQIASAGLGEQVQLLGALPQGEVRRRIEAADAVVLASVVTSYGKMEGIPVALMEALAAERAVVATRISGVPELVEDEVSGLLVEPGDARALSEALERLATDSNLRARFGRAGRAKVLREFNLHESAATLDGLFRHDWAHGPPAAMPQALAPETEPSPGDWPAVSSLSL